MMVDSESRTNEIITLTVDKIEKHCFLVGAGYNSKWRETGEGHVWDCNRIGKLIYSKMSHSEDSFDHSISVRWKKPIGIGKTNPGILKDIMIEHEGAYYYPCAFGFYVYLWHPNRQEFQESAPLSGSVKRAHWRPIYKYGEDEVWSALEILCKHYGWDLERGEDGQWITHTCGSGTIVYGEPS